MGNLKYYHPKDLVSIFHSLGKAKGDIEHLAYKIDYFLKKDLRKKQFNFRYNKLTINNHTTNTVKDMLAHRLEQLSFSNRILIRTYEGNIESPLIHGFSSASVLETSITIHPIYGVPYLPSSSIKGIVRNYFLQTFFNGSETKLNENANRTEEEEQLYKLYTDIFGSQSQRGQVSFLDAFVVSGLLRPDIMAVHSRDYYSSSGKRPATDESPPLPINFYVLTSTEPVEFTYFLQKGKRRLSDFSDEALLKIVGKWLTSALTLTGIGSKTTRGYGRFNILSTLQKKK